LKKLENILHTHTYREREGGREGVREGVRERVDEAGEQRDDR